MNIEQINARRNFDHTIESVGCFIISEGTLRTQDLLPKYLNMLAILEPGAHQQLTMTSGHSQIPSHALEDEDADWWRSDHCDYVIESIVETLEAAAPEGFYFGSNEGDGACIGFFPCEEGD